MASWFPPHNAAVDFFAACCKYTPGDDDGALFRLQAALPQMVETCWYYANGWRQIAGRVQADLKGGLKPEMAQVFADIFKLSAKAAMLAQGLPDAFLKIHSEDVRRFNTRGAHTANVPASGRV